MIVDGINLIDGVIKNAAVESSTTLPITNLDTGRLFYLTQVDGINNPGLYIYNGTDWETSGETGDITGIVAGTGLTGGGNSGSVQLDIDAAVVASVTVTDNLDTNKVNVAGDTMSGNLDLGANKIVSLGTPTAGTDATNKTYVDDAIGGVDVSNKVSKTGDTMSGDLLLSGSAGVTIGTSKAKFYYYAPFSESRIDYPVGETFNITQNGATKLAFSASGSQIDVNGCVLALDVAATNINHATRKDYVDNAISTAVSGFDLSGRVDTTGDTMSGDLLLSGSAGVTIGTSKAKFYYYAPFSESRIDYPVGETFNITQNGATKLAFSASGSQIDVNGCVLALDVAATNINHATRKDYVDNAISTAVSGFDLSGRVDTTGDTMTGILSLSAQGLTVGTSSEGTLEYIDGENSFNINTAATKAFSIKQANVQKMVFSGDGTRIDLNNVDLTLDKAPTAVNHATRKDYVDTAISTALSGIDLSSRVDISGDTMTGALILDADPSVALGAATKQYVDSVATGLDVKASVRAASTGDLSLSGTQTVDDVSLIAGDRILVKNQSTGSENGIYDVAAGAWTRSTDADNTPSNEVTSGMFTFIEEGTANADSGWTLSTADPIVLDTTALTFTQFSGAGTVNAGTGMTKAGDTLNVIGGTGITANANDIELDLTYTDGRYIQQAENAASATKLNTARDIALGGDLSGNASFDGTSNITITATIDTVGTYTDNRTTNKTLVHLETIFVNTTGSQLTMNLPGSPNLGDTVTIIDQKGTFGTNKCVVARNGGVIMGLTQDMDITTNNASVTLVYSNAADGWRIK